MASLITPTGYFGGNCDPDFEPPSGYRLTLADPPEGMSAPYWNDDLEQWWGGPPVPDASPPNLSGFRVDIMSDSGFKEWELELPPPLRENLKLAALAGNLDELQGIYDYLALNYPPPPEDRDRWQAIADSNHVDLML